LSLLFIKVVHKQRKTYNNPVKLTLPKAVLSSNPKAVTLLQDPATPKVTSEKGFYFVDCNASSSSSSSYRICIAPITEKKNTGASKN